jgi:hypothetical protein
MNKLDYRRKEVVVAYSEIFTAEICLERMCRFTEVASQPVP